MKQFSLKTIFPYLFILAVSLPLVVPYFHSGYFPTHDGEWAVVRLSDMFRSLRDHQFPVRYSGVLNFEYGYPLFNFAYPLPYYLGILFHFLHFNFVSSIKILFALSVPLSLTFMYLLSERLWKNHIAGIISVLLYAYLPYRFIDLFVRGSLGESFAFVLFPFILFMLLQIQQNKKVGIVGLASGAAMLITSHNIMSVLYLPILIIFMGFSVLQTRNKTLIKPYIVSLILALTLSAFFWLPALAEKHLISLSVIPIADRSLYFLKPLDLFIPKWGYDTPTSPNGFGYQLGLPQLSILVLTIFVALLNWGKSMDVSKKSPTVFLPIILVILFALITLLFSPTAFIWEHTPLLKEINYPWTLLLPIGFFLSLGAGYLATQRKAVQCIAVLLALSSVLLLPHARPQSYVDRGEGFYATNEATTTSSSELMPVWVKKYPTNRPSQKIEIVQGIGSIVQSKSKSNNASAVISLQTNGKIRLNTIYYPGWQLRVDNIPLRSILFQNSSGVMEFELSKGVHMMVATFAETPLRMAADMISLLGVLGLFTFSIAPLRKLKL